MQRRCENEVGPLLALDDPRTMCRSRLIAGRAIDEPRPSPRSLPMQTVSAGGANIDGAAVSGRRLAPRTQVRCRSDSNQDQRGGLSNQPRAARSELMGLTRSTGRGNRIDHDPLAAERTDGRADGDWGPNHGVCASRNDATFECLRRGLHLWNIWNVWNDEAGRACPGSYVPVRIC